MKFHEYFLENLAKQLVQIDFIVLQPCTTSHISPSAWRRWKIMASSFYFCSSLQGFCVIFWIAVCLRVCYVEQWSCGNENLKLWEAGEWSFVPQFQVPHSVFIQFRDPKMLHSWFFFYQASWATNGLDKVHSCCGHVVSWVYLCRASARQAHFTWQKRGMNWSLDFYLL